MDIFINNVKVNVEGKNKKITRVIKELEAQLTYKGEIITKVIVDGCEVGEKNVLLDKRYKVLELQTKKHRTVVLESLYLANRYIKEFYNVWFDIRFEKPIDKTKMMELVGFLEWASGLLYLLKEVTKVDMMYKDYDNFMKGFKGFTLEVTEGLIAQKYEETFMLIRNVLIDYIRRFECDYKEYLVEVFKEEQRRDLIN